MHQLIACLHAYMFACHSKNRLNRGTWGSGLGDWAALLACLQPPKTSFGSIKGQGTAEQFRLEEAIGFLKSRSNTFG
jgi:hypothetical protein